MHSSPCCSPVPFCFPAMRGLFWRRARRGRILVVASMHGLVASPFKAGYVAAKHGVVGLVKTLALEGAAAGIRAVALCPAYVRTPLVIVRSPPMRGSGG